ncbi:MAG: nucleoside-diphosphate sugar epimerase/dehydratase [Coriobacteriia bacterium]|nr:nucleoside-diphosphate sugar epimerase/dehydratase [Coriobacteriia bacterium]
MVSTFIAYWAASWLTNVYGEVFIDNEIFFTLGILALINIVILGAFRLYNHLWEYASLEEALQIVLAVVLATLTGAAFLWIINVRLPIRVFAGACILLVFLIGGSRMIYRITRRKPGTARGMARLREKRPRSLIVGAGETGSLTIQRMSKHDPLMPGIPIVATDDDPKKRKMRIHGVKVEGGSDDIVRLVDKYDIEQIVVAIPSATMEERKRIYEICMRTDCKLKTLPNVRELRVDELDGIGLRDVDVADLLGRDEILLNTRAVAANIAGETVLVTGGGGSIGSELCRQLCMVAPARLVIFDIYENDAYMLCNELSSRYDDVEIIVEIGSVCEQARIDEVFDKYRPAAVYHAAAHKHVPLMETCPREALRNNVLGTLYTVRAADRVGVNRFTFISTDKAVNPTSVMGATKRMGEMIIQYYARTSKTIFSAVRFGNVLGSHGSVIPLFQRQIAAGGPVTVTHPDIERYFMTIPEAARLVVQASIMGKGGEIFILNMGEPVKIVDLARNLIQLSGLEPDVDIKIEFTGLRPGEKMYEELLMDQETTIPTRDSRIMVSAAEVIGIDDMNAKIEDITAAISGTDEEAIAAIERAVPTYHYTVHEA